MKRSEMDLYAARLLAEITRHVGRQNTIGMGELYEIVFRERWNNRINDTRDLRKVITELRKSGVAICSDSGRESGGYYLASAGSEMEGYLKRLRRKALKALKMEAQLRKTTLLDLFGQIELELSGGES
jgi:hypothetical protein